MAPFKFKNYDRNIEIAGCKFNITCNTYLSDKVEEFGKECSGLAEKVKSGKKTSADALTACSIFLDSILGDGATEKIFANRKITLSDCADIIVYLANEITEQIHTTQVSGVKAGNKKP